MAKTSALRIRIDPELHDEFLTVCKELDIPASQVLRQHMRQFVDDHNLINKKNIGNRTLGEIRNGRT